MELEVSTRDSIALIELNRPEKLNALSVPLLEALSDTLNRVAGEGHRAVVLAGRGRAFCAGADMHDLSTTDPIAGRNFLKRVQGILAQVRELPKPVVAAVQGYAVGGGCEIALEADFRVFAADAAIGLPDVLIGSTPATLHRLVSTIGLARAKRMAMLGEFMQAEEALACGLAYKVTPTDQLLDEAMILAARLAALSPLSMDLTKASFHIAENADPYTNLRYALEAMSVCFASSEQAEATRSFLAERGG